MLQIMVFQTVGKKMLYSPIRLLLPRFFSSSNPPFMVADYLVSSFGITPAKAARISKPIASLKSPQNPDAVHCFLQHQGFSEAEIKTIITWCPKILCSSPHNTLDPNLRALRSMGLSSSALTQLILSGPSALLLRSAVPKIMFWRNFVADEEAALVKVFKRNRGLISLDIDKGIATKLSLLESHGISSTDMRRIASKVPGFMKSKLSFMEDMLKHTKELGFNPQSGMFVHGLHAMKCISKERLQKKIKLLESFGWSKEDFLSAFRKSPNIVGLSEENLRAKMEFLLGEARCDLSYINFRPVLLTLSLEKRLRSRHHVLCLLESKNLLEKLKEFFTAVQFNESKFVAKYIFPHKEEIPELHKVYLAACSAGS